MTNQGASKGPDELNTPEKLTSWLWCRFVGAPAARPGWAEEHQHLLDVIKRFHRLTWTQGLHEGQRQQKAMRELTTPQVREEKLRGLVGELMCFVSQYGHIHDNDVSRDVIERLRIYLASPATADQPAEGK